MRLPDVCPHCGCNLEAEDCYSYFLNLYKDEKEAKKMSFIYDAVNKGDKFNRLVAIYDRDRDRTTHFECPDCKGKVIT